MKLQSIYNRPTCDNECALYGWNQEYIIGSNDNTMNMHVSVHPDADIDDSVIVFSHDEQKCITILGYNWQWEQING